MEIIPAILAQSESEFVKKVERVRPLGLNVHVDVMDGIFVPNLTWADPVAVDEIMDDLTYGVHLMVAAPEHAVPVWAVSGADTVFFHVESTHRHKLIIRAINQPDKIGITINPGTPVSDIGSLLDVIAAVLIMSVVPGQSGQRFDEGTLNKIKEIKRLRPNLRVLVDGGVKPYNVAAIATAGADAVVVGSALTDSPDPAQSLAEFRHQLSGMFA
jgi:ribulose-phosphate 3-epimerase